jgi:hypothetical protein
MQRFTVPQFIDVEDKIIGPITTRQFLVLLGGAILIAIFYKLFDFSAFLLLSIIVFIMTVVVAFVKINGRPFHYFLLNIIQTSRRRGARVWNNRLAAEPNPERVPTLKFDSTRTAKEYYEKSRLAELSLIVDTQGEYRGDEEGSEIIT